MTQSIHQCIEDSSQRHPNNIAIWHKDKQINYLQLWQQCMLAAEQFKSLGLLPGARIAVYLPKLPETLYAFFGANLAGYCFVPVNPVLKPHQVVHILKDSGAKVIVSSTQRLKLLAADLQQCEALEQQIAIDSENPFPQSNNPRTTSPPGTGTTSGTASGTGTTSGLAKPDSSIPLSLAALLYTSGSTGKPKGVMITHRNLTLGAESVSGYLKMTEKDRLLALLPLSFDYGLNQITSSFKVGASVVLFDYLLPRDVVKAMAEYEITGLAAVPPLWQQLAVLDWPPEATQKLRYFTNSGGAMPLPTLAKLRQIFSQAEPYLMYGLTEAFRSTYLPPEAIDEFPTAMGKAIPGAELLILRTDGSEVDIDEVGELVHLGELVSPGYWQNEEKTRKRFKPVAIANGNIGVWSGDQVYCNAEGYLFFVSRMDDMIKTSGYRVSPGEIEAELIAHEDIKEVVVISAPHSQLGGGIIAIIIAKQQQLDEKQIRRYCMKQLTNFMVPHHIALVDTIPRNANGKVDRALLKEQYSAQFLELSGT